MTRLCLFTLCSALALSACGPQAPDSCSTVTGEHCDGQNDPKLLGAWHRKNPQTRASLGKLDFAAATWSYQDAFSAKVEGSYHSAAGWLIRDAGDGNISATPYAVSGDKLLLDVLAPDGAHQGIVGTWSGEVKLVQPDGSTHVFGQRLVFGAGGMVSLERTMDGQRVESKSQAYRGDDLGRFVMDGGGAAWLVDESLSFDLLER